MTTELEELEREFETLIPQSVKDLGRDHPDRPTYNDLTVYTTREQVEELFDPLHLTKVTAQRRLIRLWEDHPMIIKSNPAPQTGNISFFLSFICFR